MSIIYFEGMLGLHVIFALTWIVGTFLGLSALLRLSKHHGDVAAAKRARMSQVLAAAGGGLTVLIGIGFYYYINFYRTTYATSSSGLPLVDAGAALGFIVFVWQMAMSSRIRKSLKTTMATTVTSGAESSSTQSGTTLPKSWMLIAPAVLLLVAFVLMIGGSMM